MKSLFTHKASIAIVSFLGGVLITNFYFFVFPKASRVEKPTSPWMQMFSLFNSMHEDPHLDDFFQQAQRNMLQMDHFNQLNTFGQMAGGIGAISQREDDSYVYIDIDLSGQTPKEFKVEVRNGLISVRGKLESREESNGFSGIRSASFNKSFPAPANVNLSTYQVEPADGKVTIKFEKM
jgi:HSP20 family molecular chaperone IbpA